jgi:hypothetical protein
LYVEIDMPVPPRVALATCSHFPDGDPDDAGLTAAVAGSEFVIWDDASVDWGRYDLVVLRSTWDYQHRRAEYLEWTRAVGDRLLNPPSWSGTPTRPT